MNQFKVAHKVAFPWAVPVDCVELVCVRQHKHHMQCSYQLPQSLYPSYKSREAEDPNFEESELTFIKIQS